MNYSWRWYREHNTGRLGTAFIVVFVRTDLSAGAERFQDSEDVRSFAARRQPRWRTMLIAIIGSTIPQSISWCKKSMLLIFLLTGPAPDPGPGRLCFSQSLIPGRNPSPEDSTCGRIADFRLIVFVENIFASRIDFKVFPDRLGDLGAEYRIIARLKYGIVYA
jgi:hypothetical protein